MSEGSRNPELFDSDDREYVEYQPEPGEVPCGNCGNWYHEHKTGSCRKYRMATLTDLYGGGR